MTTPQDAPGKLADMLMTLLAVIAMAALALGYAFVLSNAQAQSALSGRASVIDGDTLEIHGQRIRLAGIDAPESGARCGNVNIYQAAANALAAHIGEAPLTCTPTGAPDRYGRVVAQCRLAGEDLNTWLVEQGWARDWPRYSRGRYASAEARARAGERGVWAANCPQSIWGARNYSR